MLGRVLMSVPKQVLGWREGFYARAWGKAWIAGAGSASEWEKNSRVTQVGYTAGGGLGPGVFG